MRRAVVLLIGLTLLAGGCSSGKGASSSTASPPAGSGATTSTQPPTATAPNPSTTALANASASPVSVPDRMPTAVLTALRTAHQPGFDRVVFEFAGPPVPGYLVERKTGQPTQDGSGKPVAVAGEAYLFVRMANASEADPTDGHIVYKGPTRLTPPDTTVVTEVVAIGDFEGVLSWAIGLNRKDVIFRVSEMASPPRLVIDIAT